MREIVEPESCYIEAHGLRLHYLDWGNQNAEPILLVHGLQDCSGLWNSFAVEFREQYHVIALDQRGHGDSERANPNRYKISDYVRELSEVIEALDLKNLTLIGHSAGAKNSWIYTADNPERLDKLILVDMDPDSFNPGSEEMRKRYREESDLYSDLKSVTERLRIRQPNATQEMLLQNAIVMTKSLPDGQLTWRRDREVVTSYDRPDAWDYLPKIRVPTLLVHGAISTLLVSNVADRMEQMIPDCARVDIPDGGHWSHLEFPSLFAEAVAKFLAASD